MFGKPAPNRGIKRPGIGGRKKGSAWSDNERNLQMTIRSTNQHKEKMTRVYADANRNQKISEHSKGKIGAAKGKKWYNNSIAESYFVEPPPGWLRGRLPRGA